MKLHRPGWRGIVLSSAVVAAAAAITFGATLLFGMPFGGDDATPAGAHVPGVRDRLAICVDVYDPGGGLGSGPAVQAIKDRAQAAIRDGLVRVKQHPLWEKTGLQAKGEPEVDVGCPSPPLPSRNTDDRFKLKDGIGPMPGGIPGAVVEEPSYYFLFVFLAPLEEIDRLLGGSTVRLTDQEYVHHGDVFMGVTIAMYLTPDEVKDELFFLQKLEEGVGVREVQGPR